MLWLAVAELDPAERIRALELALATLERRHHLLQTLDTATQPLEEPREIMQTAARLLATYLGADRRAYANVDDERVFDITGDWSTGYEVARALRAADATRGAALLVAVTGWRDEGSRKRTAEAGFDAHLVKPIDRRQLDALLARAAAARPRSPGNA